MPAIVKQLRRRVMQVGSCGSESNYSDNEEDDDSVFVIRMSSMGKESGVHAEQEHQQSG